jgi:ABC-type multidrug transport system fused ATPase/permease subunit
LRNEVGWFDEEEHNSSLVAARLATDAADVKSAIAERISVILQNMTSLLTSFIVAFIVEWRVSLLILATFPLLVLANFAQVSFSRSVLQNNNASITFLLVFSSILCESWSNTSTYPQSHASLERAQ